MRIAIKTIGFQLSFIGLFLSIASVCFSQSDMDVEVFISSKMSDGSFATDAPCVNSNIIESFKNTLTIQVKDNNTIDFISGCDISLLLRNNPFDTSTFTLNNTFVDQQNGLYVYEIPASPNTSGFLNFIGKSDFDAIIQKNNYNTVNLGVNYYNQDFKDYNKEPPDDFRVYSCSNSNFRGLANYNGTLYNSIHFAYNTAAYSIFLPFDAVSSIVPQNWPEYESAAKAVSVSYKFSNVSSAELQFFITEYNKLIFYSYAYQISTKLLDLSLNLFNDLVYTCATTACTSTLPAVSKSVAEFLLSDLTSSTSNFEKFIYRAIRLNLRNSKHNLIICKEIVNSIPNYPNNYWDYSSADIFYENIKTGFIHSKMAIDFFDIVLSDNILMDILKTEVKYVMEQVAPHSTKVDDLAQILEMSADFTQILEQVASQNEAWYYQYEQSWSDTGKGYELYNMYKGTSIYRTDKQAPNTIDDFSASYDSNTGDYTLQWEAPNPNGGNLSRYVVKYSQSPINTENDWNAAYYYSDNIAATSAPGTGQTQTVTGLPSNLFFAVRAIDDSENLSPVSAYSNNSYQNNDISLVANFYTPTAFTLETSQVNFYDLSSPQFKIETWLWNFGDGNTSNQKNSSNVYATAGEYTVTLTVSDGVNFATKTIEKYIKVTDVPNFLFINKTQMIAHNGSGSFGVFVNSDVGWSVTSGCSWANIASGSSGTDNGSFSVLFDANPNTVQRECTLTVNGAGVNPQNLIIYQYPADVVVDPYLIVTPSDTTVSSLYGNMSYFVKSNQTWTAVINSNPSTMISNINTSNTSGNGTVTAYYNENINSTPRTATITVSTGSLTFDVNLTQEANKPELLISPVFVDVSSQSGTQSAFSMVSKSMNWDAVSNASFCTLNPATNNWTNNAIINVIYNSNSSTSSRQAEITVFPDINSGLPIRKVILFQRGAPYLQVTPSNVNINGEMASTTAGITSNVKWHAIDTSQWITVVPPLGYGDGIINVHCEENNTGTNRISYITVTDSSGLSKTIKIEQNAIGYIEVDTNIFLLGAAQGDTTFQINSNITWIISTNSSWFNLDPMLGTGNSTIGVTNIVANNGISNKVASIDVYSYPDSILKESILFRQNPIDHLIGNPDTMMVSYLPVTAPYLVNSNMNWNVFHTAQWIDSITPSSGENTLSIDVKLQENTSLLPRMTEIFLVSSDGNYKDTVILIQDGFTGVVEKDSDNLTGAFKVYPNPTSGYVNILINDLEADYDELIIYNKLGQVVYEEEVEHRFSLQTISVGNLPVGIYNIQLKGINSSHSEKIIIVK